MQELGRFLEATGHAVLVIFALIVVLRIVGWLTGA